MKLQNPFTICDLSFEMNKHTQIFDNNENNNDESLIVTTPWINIQRTTME